MTELPDEPTGARRRRRREPLIPPAGGLAALVVCVVALAALLLVKPHHRAEHTRTTPDSTSHTAKGPTTTLPATTTTIDVGALTQTPDEPVASDPANQARAKVLFDAIVAGRPDDALPAFFPKSAYLQVKQLADPASDYDNRLIAQFRADITALHATVVPAGQSAAPTFVRLDVVKTPVWVKPGVESNKGSYWRVYDSLLRYTVNGVAKSVPIKSMISWRGQWYVVHLVAIK